MNRAARSLIADNWDRGDVWGSALAHHFGVANTLHAVGGPIPAEWEYRPAAAYEFDEWPDCEWLALYDAGQITVDELVHVGTVLDRYEDALVRAGEDY